MWLFLPEYVVFGEGRTETSSTLRHFSYCQVMRWNVRWLTDWRNYQSGVIFFLFLSVIKHPSISNSLFSPLLLQGKQLESTAGILVSNMTLVLQKVARSNAGTYTCHATNSEGSAASPPLNLDVKCECPCVLWSHCPFSHHSTVLLFLSTFFSFFSFLICLWFSV